MLLVALILYLNVASTQLASVSVEKPGVPISPQHQDVITNNADIGGVPAQLLLLPVIHAGDLMLRAHTTPTCSCPADKLRCNCNPLVRRSHQSSARSGKLSKEQDPRWAALPLVKVGNKRYFFVTSNKMRWLESIQFCTLLGMDSVTLWSAEETRLLATYVAASDFRESTLWVNGGSSIGTSGNYRWLTSGQPLVEQHVVMSLENLESPLKRCLVLNSGQLQAEYCDHQGLNFMCEIRDQ